MTILFIILGVLLFGTGISCIFTPLTTLMNAGYFVVILIFISGVFGVIRAIIERRLGISFVFSILSLILGTVMLSFPDALLVAESVMIIMTAVWFVLMGAVTIFTAVKFTKATGSKIWIPQLISGILAVLIGGYSFFQPMLMAVSLGVLIGIYFIETGLTLILVSAAKKNL